MQDTTQILLTDILVEDRQRKDYGDLDELADSIRELGLIHPLVLAEGHVTHVVNAREGTNYRYRLVAGGRRIEAIKLLGVTTLFHGVTCDRERYGFVFQSELTQEMLFEIELEENIRRKEITWTERLMNVKKAHDIKSQRSALEGKKWGYRQTGAMLNMPLANVGYALQIAAEIQREPEGAVAQASTMSDALRILVQRKEDEANKLLVERTLPAQPAQPKVTVPKLDGVEVPPSIDVIDTPPADEVIIPLRQMLHLGDCLPFLAALPEGSFDHCITDTPYAIDMDMLEQQNPHGGMNDIDRIRETHVVDENLSFLAKLIPETFRVLKPSGFFVTWADQMTWQQLYDWGINAGFRVQRWPITWVKMHQCMNQQAQYNFTKNTEIAIVMRKPGATLAKPSPNCVVMASNSRDAKKLGHPFVKPFEAWEFLARHIALPGQHILEPCAGVGSGVLSFLQLGMKVTACEIDEKHYNNLVLNVQQHYTALHANCRFV